MKSKMNLHTCNFEYLQADQPGHPGGGRAFLFEKEESCKTLEISKKTIHSWISKQFLWKGKQTQFFKLSDYFQHLQKSYFLQFNKTLDVFHPCLTKFPFFFFTF